MLSREARLHVRRKPPGLLGGYVLGLAFAFGWTPCIGPILAAILALAGAEETVGSGAFLLLVYSLGLGVPFLLAAAFAPVFLGWASRFRRRLPAVEKAMGGFLVLTGVLFVTGHMTAMSYWLLETFPGLATIG
jgi:cytochrome c-type biogenesis protein